MSLKGLLKTKIYYFSLSFKVVFTSNNIYPNSAAGYWLTFCYKILSERVLFNISTIVTLKCLLFHSKLEEKLVVSFLCEAWIYLQHTFRNKVQTFWCLILRVTCKSCLERRSDVSSLHPSPKDEIYVNFVKTFAMQRRKLQRSYKVYAFLISIKFCIGVSMSVCPSV